MCGIVGILRFDGRPVARRRDRTDGGQHPPPRSGRSGASSPRAASGIGMRRLSIVDRQPAGHQPLFNEDGSVAVVFNGEIYNHRDIRSRVELAGPRLARQQRHRGAGSRVRAARRRRAVPRACPGMFAFALLRSPPPARVPGPRRVRDQAALRAADAAAAVVRVRDPRAGIRRRRAALRRSPAFTRTYPARRVRPLAGHGLSRASSRCTPGRCTRSISTPARRASRRSTGCAGRIWTTSARTACWSSCASC